MIGVHLDGVTVTYGLDPIFENLSWQIHDDRCVGLVGINGCGKSTLLRLIAGQLHSESGYTLRSSGLTIGYLQQEPQFQSGKTVWKEVHAASADLYQLEKELQEVENNLTDPAVYNNEKKLTRALDHQARLLEKYTRLGGPSYDGLVRSTLFSLGFKEADLQLTENALSGGQKKLVGLAKLLIQQPKLLLLDEPDNHLDLESKYLLEKIIRDYPGGVVIVSHDRFLLDLVADEIAELEAGKLQLYKGNYSEYVFEKELLLHSQVQQFRAQQKEITRLEQSAHRLLTWGKVFDNEKFSKRGQNILKRLEKMERLDKPITEYDRMGLQLTGGRGSEKVLEIKHLAKSFQAAGEDQPGSQRIILDDINLLVMRKDRIGLIGPNGSGKSLLFRLILEQEAPDAGVIEIGPSIKIGYYAQQHETLDYQRTLIDPVRHAARFTEEAAVAFLKKFLFSYRQSRSLAGTLSGGERSRLQMALLMLSGANFLMLDEPTNNLDIRSIEVLEDALDDFDGTILVISHDRYFLDRVVNRMEEIEEGRLCGTIGSYSEYMDQKRPD
jgi:ATP-binding cassette subfamily F protein 3